MIALENVGLAPRSDLNEQFPLDPSRTALIVVDMQYLSGCRTIGLGKRFADAGQDELSRALPSRDDGG